MNVANERVIMLEESNKHLKSEVQELSVKIEKLASKEWILKIILIVMVLLVMGYKEALKIGMIGMG